MDFPPRPTTDYAFLEDELNRYDADAYVHVGDCFDEMLRYLTRFGGPDRPYAFVYADGTPVLCAPDRFGEQAEREFPGEVDTTNASARPPAEERAMTVLDDVGDVTRLLLPATARHRTVTSFTDAGYDAALTDTAEEGRIVKSDREQRRLAAVELAAQRGMARAETVLAEATVADDVVRWEGEPLTTERIRREINAELARNGVTDAANTVVGAGRSCADLHFTGHDTVRPGETVLIDLGPRGPLGYHGDMTRTFVPGEPGEWELEAYEAVSDAFAAGLDRLAEGEGIAGTDITDAVADALGNHGFRIGDVDVGLYHGVGHGIGVSIHERPFLSTDETLRAGSVITFEPGVYDPDHGGVRLEDMFLVTEDGYENYTEYPKTITPSPRSI